MNAKIQDHVNSFKAQIESKKEWVSQNEIDQTTEFIYDAIEAEYSTRKEAESDRPKRAAIIREQIQAEKEVREMIAQIVSNECDKRNNSGRK
jgi:GTPase involved in cell partitioning and DNA repair